MHARAASQPGGYARGSAMGGRPGPQLPAELEAAAASSPAPSPRLTGSSEMGGTSRNKAHPSRLWAAQRESTTPPWGQKGGGLRCTNRKRSRARSIFPPANQQRLWRALPPVPGGTRPQLTERGAWPGRCPAPRLLPFLAPERRCREPWEGRARRARAASARLKARGYEARPALAAGGSRGP